MGADILLMIVYMCILGAAIGTLSGLIPGIHVNTLAVILLAFSVPLQGAIALFSGTDAAPLMLACCVMSAAVVHTGVSFVPSAFIGLPDTDTVLSILPAHRMVFSGDGLVAVRCAAIGSLTGAVTSLILIVPLYILLDGGLGAYLDSITVGILIIVLIMMVAGERNGRRLLAVMTIAASGIMGLIVMLNVLPMSTAVGIGPETMFPLLTGLFGIPSLIWHSDTTIPPQKESEPFPVSPLPGIKGVLTGSLTGWFPGITSTAGAMVAGRIFGLNGPREFICMVSSIGTASTIFTFITLCLTGKERSGTMSVISELLTDADMSLGSEVFVCMVVSMAIASVLTFIITIRAGALVSTVVQRADMSAVSRIVLVSMIVLTILFCGYWGLIVLLVCTLIGMAPLLLGLHRIHLTGCLIVPVLLFRLGLF